MHIIKAHRKRIAELSKAFNTLMESERMLLDLRSKSWGLQMLGDASRKSDLKLVHAEIDDTTMEVERLRDFLIIPRQVQPPAENPARE